jgi:ethanolamine utilization protein EutN
MILARVVGTVVATRKDSRLEGKSLMVLQPVDADDQPTGNYVVAVDTVSAGVGQRVIAVSGSSARMAEGCTNLPTDCSIVGIVDEFSIAAKAARKPPGT